MAWLMLVGAIGCEIAATSLLPSTDGFRVVAPTLGTIGLYAVSFVLVAQVTRTIPVSVTYAIWSGVGTATVAAIGFTILDEPVSVPKIAGIALIVAGVVLVNIGGTH
jgi:small multidrug resistance pump